MTGRLYNVYANHTSNSGFDRTSAIFYSLPNNEWGEGVWERSGSMVECLTRDREAAGSSLTGVTALWSLSEDHIYPSLVLVQPRKTRPCLTERLLMGCKESNQTTSGVPNSVG